MSNKENSKINGYLIFLKQYMLEIYTSRLAIFKLIAFFIIGFVVIFTSFGVRESILSASKVTSLVLIPNFLNMELVFNEGVAFGNLGDAPSWVVYLVQSIPLIVGFIAIIFSKSLFIDVPLLFLFFGGFCNVVDRGIVDIAQSSPNEIHKDAVVDYFQFTFVNFAIFNLPDVYVVGSVILLGIVTVTYFVKDLKKDKNTK